MSPQLTLNEWTCRVVKRGVVCVFALTASLASATDDVTPTSVQADAKRRVVDPLMLSPEMKQPTACPGEERIWGTDDGGDGDIRLHENANLRIMFHGNRFVAAKELVAAFEGAHPEARISYTAIPPIHTFDKLFGKPAKLPMLDDFGQPDVVMLPWDGAASTDGVQLYSRVRGMVLVARAGDGRVTDRDAPITRPELKIVFQGEQHVRVHATYTVPRAYYGKDRFDGWMHSSRAGFSQRKHHRSVPARLLVGCEDIGFQYKQSQAFLEQVLPGRFKFFDIPSAAENFEGEISYLRVLVPANALANRFAEFMLGDRAQGVLAKYSLQK